MNNNDVVDLFFDKTKEFGIPILVCQTGSKAYGLDTPESDDDFKGIFIPNLKYSLGLSKVEMLKVKGDDWTNHTIQHYLKALISMNPTMMELLFIENPVCAHSFWEHYLPHFKGLISKRAFKPYSAYVLSQLNKAKYRHPTEKRADLIEKYGYDTKFMSHVARLAVQCIYLMREHYIPVRVPEPFREAIMQIKTGQVSKDEALAYCEALDKGMHEAYTKTTLPEEANIDKFEQDVYIPMMKEILNEWL